MSEIRIEGLEALYKQLQELPAKIEQNVMRGALRAGQKTFLERARAGVPVKSGDLKNSLRIKTSARRGVVTATLIAGDKKAYYAHMVERGTAAHFIKPKSRKSLFFAGLMKEVVHHPGAQKKPFMRPAFDQGNREAIEATAQYIRDRLPKEFKKL